MRGLAVLAPRYAVRGTQYAVGGTQYAGDRGLAPRVLQPKRSEAA